MMIQEFYLECDKCGMCYPHSSETAPIARSVAHEAGWRHRLVTNGMPSVWDDLCLHCVEEEA